MQHAPRVLFYVQHLLGIGHLKRAALLARAWQAAGLEVTVVAGGEPVDGVSFAPAALQPLPAIRATDAAFSGLVTAQGEPVDEQFKRRRTEQLLNLFRGLRPDILVIESYPFGRRQLRWELLPLLQAAQRAEPRPLICSSIRDILQQRRLERVDESLELVERYFDGVLVHGDPDFIPLSVSLPGAHRITDRLGYTGYVTDPALPTHQPVANAEVIVSAGGGAVGFKLMSTALAAKPLSPLADRVWRLLVGPNLPQDALASLRQQADEGVIIEPVRQDFVQLLSRCALSISQGGYNTIMDLLGVGCPAVWVPFEGSGETEQLTRCQRLQAAGVGQLVRESALDGDALAAAIHRALLGSKSLQQPLLARDGGLRSAQILKQWLGARHE